MSENETCQYDKYYGPVLWCSEVGVKHRATGGGT